MFAWRLVASAALIVLQYYMTNHPLKRFITPAHWAVAVTKEQIDLSVHCTHIFMVCNRCCGIGSSGRVVVIEKKKKIKE